MNVCYNCGLKLPDSEEERKKAQEELAQNFPGTSVQESHLVCTECYVLIMAWWLDANKETRH